MVKVFEFLSDNKTNGYTLTMFKKDWQQLDDKSKVQLKAGVANGTLDYEL